MFWRSACLFFLAGCAGAQVAPGTKVELPPGRGLLVIGAGDGVRIRTLRLRDKSDTSEEAIISNLAPREIAVLALPATTYCVVEIESNHVSYFQLDPSKSKWCFDVRGRHLGYAGHVVVNELQTIRMTQAPADACRALQADYADAIAAVSTTELGLESCR